MTILVGFLITVVGMFVKALNYSPENRRISKLCDVLILIGAIVLIVGVFVNIPYR
jgi:uncharacterized membrane protein